jgi:hypothetical protein
MNSPDTTAVKYYCSECNKELGNQYYWIEGKHLCSKCFTGHMLQNKNWYLISDNVCHCDTPIVISICPKCGKPKYSKGEIK